MKSIQIRKAKYLGVLCLMLFGMVLAACSPAATEAPVAVADATDIPQVTSTEVVPEPEPEVAEPEPEVAEPEPAAEKTLVYVTPSLPISLDPCVIPGQQTAEIIMNTSWFWW